MLLNPRYRHTEAQKAVIAETDAMVIRSFIELLTQARKIKFEQVALHGPDGPTHGANMDCYRRHEALTNAAMSMTWVMDRDLVDLVKYQLHYLGGHFVTDEVYAKQYSHIDGEIRRLGAKFPEYVL